MITHKAEKQKDILTHNPSHQVSGTPTHMDFPMDKKI